MRRVLAPVPLPTGVACSVTAVASRPARSAYRASKTRKPSTRPGSNKQLPSLLRLCQDAILDHPVEVTLDLVRQGPPGDQDAEFHVDRERLLGQVRRGQGRERS